MAPTPPAPPGQDRSRPPRREARWTTRQQVIAAAAALLASGLGVALGAGLSGGGAKPPPSAADPSARRSAEAASASARVGSLSLELSLLAERPGEPAPHLVASGEALPPGSKVHVRVALSAPAYLYLVQRTAAGQVTLLFPTPQIPLANPVPPGRALRLPPTGAWRLEPSEGGDAVVALAALEPVPGLDWLGTNQAAGAELRLPFEVALAAAAGRVAVAGLTVGR